MPQPAPDPGFRVDYDPNTKQVTLTFNAKVTYVFDYDGKIFSKDPKDH